MPLSDSELYKGFSKEKIERYNREVRESYDPEIVSRVNRKVRNLSKEQWRTLKQEGVEIAIGLATLMNREPADSDVQALIARQHTWIENFYPADAEVFRGLGAMYTTNPEFRAHYDQFAPSLADFLHKAMEHYAGTVLENKNP